MSDQKLNDNQNNVHDNENEAERTDIKRKETYTEMSEWMNEWMNEWNELTWNDMKLNCKLKLNWGEMKLEMKLHERQTTWKFKLSEMKWMRDPEWY